MIADDRVRWAWRGATTAARRANRDRRELLGSAWQSVNRLPADADPGLCFAAAYRGALDAVRAGADWRVCGRTRLVDAADEAAALAETVDRPDRGSPEGRLLALWCECRPARAGVLPRTRLWAYLLRVEGWTPAEVAAVWGCSRLRVYKAMAEAGLAR